MPEDILRLIYRSHNQIPSDQRRAERGVLFGKARSNSKKQDVTGALLVLGDVFVQALEGDETIVRDLFATNEKDYRHDSVGGVEAGDVPERVFSK